jgi:hypothetical protein
VNARVNTQIEDVVSAWTRFQSQLWDSLFGMGKNSAGEPWEHIFNRPIEVGEDIVNSVLQQQSDCIRIAMKNARPGNGAPRVVSEWVDQIEKAAQHWVDAQRQAWHTWFAAVRQMDPYRLQGSRPKGSKAATESHAENLFEAWQQATQTTLKAQADWVSSLVSSGAKAAEEIAQSSVKTAGNGAQAVEAAAQSAKKASSAASKASEPRRGAA